MNPLLYYFVLNCGIFRFRLRASRVLLVGMRGIGAEICKNLVLSGVKSLTIVDSNPVNEQDFLSQFLVQRQDLGKNVSLVMSVYFFFITGYVMCFFRQR